MTNKRKYNTPFLNVERFQLNKSVSTSCQDPLIDDMYHFGYFGQHDTDCVEKVYEMEGMETPCYHTIDAIYGSY